MEARIYWLDLFTGTTWHEFLEAGAEVSGFRDSRWSIVQRVQPGDYLLCYLTGVSRFVGVLEVTSKPYRDSTPLWKADTFPCRMKVRVVIRLTSETAVPIQDLRDELSIFEGLTSPIAWTGHLRGSPAKWKSVDGDAILMALQEASANPVIRPVDPRKLARRPKALQAKIGPVTVPEDEVGAFSGAPTTAEASNHLEMQYLLLKQPNLNIPLYLVAPDDRRDKVFVEINRPTFSRLSPPLVDVCRFISFTTLKKRLEEARPYLRYLKPEFLDELSEVCDVEESQ